MLKPTRLLTLLEGFLTGLIGLAYGLPILAIVVGAIYILVVFDVVSHAMMIAAALATVVATICVGLLVRRALQDRGL